MNITKTNVIMNVDGARRITVVTDILKMTNSIYLRQEIRLDINWIIIIPPLKLYGRIILGRASFDKLYTSTV